MGRHKGYRGGFRHGCLQQSRTCARLPSQTSLPRLGSLILSDTKCVMAKSCAICRILNGVNPPNKSRQDPWVAQGSELHVRLRCRHVAGCRAAQACLMASPSLHLNTPKDRNSHGSCAGAHGGLPGATPGLFPELALSTPVLVNGCVLHSSN